MGALVYVLPGNVPFEVRLRTTGRESVRVACIGRRVDSVLSVGGVPSLSGTSIVDRGWSALSWQSVWFSWRTGRTGRIR